MQKRHRISHFVNPHLTRSHFMSITAAQMNANIELWQQQIAKLQEEFNQASNKTEINRDTPVPSDAQAKSTLVLFQNALQGGIDLVDRIRKDVTSFKKGASAELASTVDKARQVWARAINVVQSGREEAKEAQDQYAGNDIVLPDTDGVFDDYSAVFPPQGFLALVLA